MVGFVYVLFVLGQLNKKIYIIMALILPKLEKPDYALWHYSMVHTINPITINMVHTINPPVQG